MNHIQAYYLLYTGVLYDNRLDPRDITEGIVYLAQQGYIKIKKTDEKVSWLSNTTDYELTLRRAVETDVPPMLQLIIKFFFTDTNSIGQTIKISSLKKEKSANRIFIKKLKMASTRRLEQDGFLIVPSEFLPSGDWVRILRQLLILIVFAGIFVINSTIAVLSIVIFVIASSNRRTAKGYEALNHIQGFKRFLSVTEKDRYDFHNTPDKSTELFMEYLPYAIAFSVEQEWSKVFAQITIPDPDWYYGDNVGGFSATAFSSDMGVFSKSFTALSGTSGSSGGGGSGGGGGGGGSW